MFNNEWNKGYEKGFSDAREPMTLREIAEVEGISHQAIVEIIERAMKKMLKAMEARGIKLEDLL